MIDQQDELNPTEEPYRALDGSSGRGKARLELSFRARWFGAKTVPPMTPHGMSEVFGLDPNIKALEPDLMKSSDPIGPKFESSCRPSIRPKVQSDQG